MSQDALRITAKKDGSNDPGDIVFLCHNSADKAFIRRISDALELEFGTRFFLDVFAIPTGEQFIPWIEKALEECAACAIFLGGNGWGPTHLWEAELALARYRRDPKFKIIPVALPGLSTEEAAKLGAGKLFQEVNWANFTKGPDDKESLEKLVSALTGKAVATYRGPARLTPYQIRRDAERWERSRPKNASVLYGGKQLVEAEAMIRDNPDIVIVAGVASFLAASRERQSTYWRRLAISALVAVGLVLMASVIAFVSYLLAEQRRLASESRQLAMISKQAVGADRALLIGAQAVLVDDTPEARGVLLEQLQEFRFLKRIVSAGGYVEAGAIGLNSDLLLGTSMGLRRLQHDQTATSPVAAHASTEAVTAVLAADGKVWLGREDGRVDEVVAGTRLTLLAPARNVAKGRETGVRSLAYDKTKRLLAVGTGAGRIAILRLTDASIAKEFDEGDRVRVNSLSFDPTRPRLAVGTSDGVISIVDTGTLHIIQRYPHIEGGVLSLGYVADGSLAAVSAEGRLLYFDGRNDKLERPVNGDVAPLATAATIDAVTSRVAVGDSSGTVWLYDAATGKSTGAEPLRGHSDKVTAIVFDPTRDALFTASANGTVAVWDLGGRQGPSKDLPQLNPAPSDIRVERTGAVLAASTEGDHAEIRRLIGDQWKLVVDLVEATQRVDKNGDLFGKPKEGADGFKEIVSRIPRIAMDESGSRVAWTTSGGAVLFLSLENAGAAPILASSTTPDGPTELTLSGKGGAIAAVDDGGRRVAIYRIDGSFVVASSVAPPSPARSAALNHEGNRLAIGMTNGDIALYRSENGAWKADGPPWSVHGSEVAGLVFSRDDRIVVSFGSGGGGADRTVALSNTSGMPDPRVLQARQASGSVSSLSIGAAAGTLAVGDQDGEVLMWSALDARYSGGLKSGTSDVSAIFVDETRQRLLTANGDGNILSLTLDPVQWEVLACAKANRPLSPEEWRELLPYDRYVDSCAGRIPNMTAPMTSATSQRIP